MSEEFIISILIIQTILISLFLFMLFKRYASLSNENSLIKTLNEKIDKLNIIDDNISALKKEIFSEKSILQKHTSDLHNSVEKINASMLNINNMLNSDSSSNFRYASLSNENSLIKTLNEKIDKLNIIDDNISALCKFDAGSVGFGPTTL